MLKRFYAQLPEFARPDHPVMRYMLLREGRRQRGSVLLRGIALALMLGGLLLCGWLLATSAGRTNVVTSNPLDTIYLFLYWPLVLLQVLVRIFAMNSTSATIAAEKRLGTWDTLKITTDGALLTLKTRWATVFYRLGLLLVLIVALRVLFVVVALINLVAFQGRYLDVMISGTIPFGTAGTSPDSSAVAGVIFLAVSMTAAILAPLTAVAFDAGLGMLVGTFSQGRAVGIFGQIGLILARVLLTVWGLWVGAAALSLTPFTDLTFALSANPGQVDTVSMWLGALAGLTEGDLGLTLLHMPHVQRLWADIDYGILAGAAFLGLILLQAALGNVFVWLAGRRAMRAERG